MMVRGLAILILAVLAGIPGAFGAGRVVDSVLYITSGTKAIKANAYEGRNDFHTVRFDKPCRVETIGRSAFAWCPNLRHIDLPATLRDIASQAFAYDGNLGNVTLPQGLTHIGANAFSFCSSMTEVSLPAGLRELESYAFSNCGSLSKVVMPANSNLLGEMIFYDCPEMESVTVDSKTPPKFDCNSQLFDLEEDYIYDGCVLRVPAGTRSRYAAAPGWRLFRHIEEK